RFSDWPRGRRAFRRNSRSEERYDKKGVTVYRRCDFTRRAILNEPLIWLAPWMAGTRGIGCTKRGSLLILFLPRPAGRADRVQQAQAPGRPQRPTLGAEGRAALHAAAQAL